MIIVNNEDCIKCGACEGTCPSAAIKVTPDNVINCDICGGDAKCVAACSKGALSVEPIAIGDEGITKDRIVFNPLKCDECGDCTEVCPTQTLKLKEGAKMPLEGFCVLCQKCVDICPVEVIGLEGVKEPKSTDLEIEGAIYIADCVGCKMCVPECPVDAISLSAIGGTIEIDEEKCIKCGVCSQTCPWNKVFISGKKPAKRSKDIIKFELNEDICIGCNSCVDACPGSFIVAKNSTLTVELPSVCAACGLCENICPVDAIDLEVELGEAKPASGEGLVCDAEKCDFSGACANTCPNEAIKVVNANGIELPSKEQVDAEPSFSQCTRCGACTMACPNGALSISTIDKTVDGEVVSRNRIQYNPSACVQCGTCTETCPYGMLKLSEDKVPLKGFCILCDQCIPACPNSALSLK